MQIVPKFDNVIRRFQVLMKDHDKIGKNYPFKISLKSSYNMYNFKNIYTPVLFFFWWVCVAHLFSFLCCPIMCFYVLSSVFCDVRYDFRIQMVFGSSLPPVVCRRDQILFARFAYSGVQHILCCDFVFPRLVYPMCCQFLWIVHFWLLLQYALQ